MSLAEQKALQSLAVIRSDVDALAAQVEVVVKSAAIGVAPAQQQLALLHELLTQALLKLDLVTGDGDVRLQRKTQIQRVNGLASQLDRAEQGAAHHDPPPGAAPAAATVNADAIQGEPSSQAVSQAASSLNQLAGEETGERQPPTPPTTLVAPASASAPPALSPPPAPSSAPLPAPVAPPASPPAPPPVSSAPLPTQTSAGRQPPSNPPVQKSPTRPSAPVAGAPMAPAPARGAGEAGRKKAAGMMSHALSLNDGLSIAKPPPLQTRSSLASSATAAYVAQQQPTRSTPNAAPALPAASGTGGPPAPSITDRVGTLQLAATVPAIAHTGSIHDLDSFFGGGASKAPTPVPVPPQAAPTAQPSFANFDGAAQGQQPRVPPSGAPASTPSPAQSPVPVQYPSPSGPKLTFPSPPRPAAPQAASAGAAAAGNLLNFAPPPPRRSSSSSATPAPDGPASFKAPPPTPTTSPQEPPRSQRRSESVPVLGNLSGFASPVPPSKPVVKELTTPPTSPAVSSFSPPAAALSSFSADLPSPATRSSLSRHPGNAPAVPTVPPPPPLGVRSSLQATSIEEALRGALSRRESASKGLPPSSDPGKAEPGPPTRTEPRPEANGQAVVAPTAGSQAAPVQASPGAAAANGSSWVAFDSDFDPRAFSGSGKSSPSTSRRSSYDLPPPPRPAQPLFPDAQPGGPPAESATAAAPAPLVSLLDGPPAAADAAPGPPPGVATAPLPAAPTPPRSEAPPQEQPSASVQPASIQQGVSGPQPVAFPAAFPTAFPASQPTTSGQGGHSAVRAANLQGVPTGGAAWGPPFGPGQPGLPHHGSSQSLPGRQPGGDLGLTSQQEAARGPDAPGNAGPGAQPGMRSSPAGLTGANPQSTPPPAALAGVTGSRPLEGFGEIERQPAAPAPTFPAYGAGWPQQGAAGFVGPAVGGGGPQGFAPVMQAPGVVPGFSGVAPQQGFAYQYRAQGQAPWLQQAGPLTGVGTGYGGFGGQASTVSGGPGQGWPYQQQTGGGGSYQAPFVGASQPLPPVAQQAPLFHPQQNVNHVGGAVPGASGTYPTGSAWSATGSPAPQGAATQTPAILPPWMIQPQQPTSSGAGNQGQGW